MTVFPAAEDGFHFLAQSMFADQKQFFATIEQIASEKGIAKDTILETIGLAVAAAYKKEYGKRGQIVRAEFDPDAKSFKLYQIKLVVDETMLKSEDESDEQGDRDDFIPPSSRTGDGQNETEEVRKVRFNPERHTMVAEAQEFQPGIQAGEELRTELPPHDDFGRIAAQTAKQVIIQRIREAERAIIYQEYKAKEGEIVSGTVQRVEGPNVFVDLGRLTALLPPEEQIPGERARIGARVRVLLLSLIETPRGLEARVSRAHQRFVELLFRSEVPEIAQGSVEIKSIAREPGSRSKVAVLSLADRIDPVGACFPGSASVLMEDFSYKPIVELAAGEFVFTHTGERRKITKTSKRPWAGSTLLVTFFGVPDPVEVTSEHPFLYTRNVASPENFVPASQIVRGGFLAIPTLDKMVVDRTIYSFELEKDFLWVLGMYLAEGHLDRAEVNFTLGSHEEAKAKRIQSAMQRFGGTVIVRQRAHRPTVLDVKLLGWDWHRIFKELGGQYSDQKKIHARLLFLEPELQMHVFEGWKDGDGHFNQKRNRTDVVTTSRELVWQMYHILLRNHIRGNIQRRKERLDRKETFVLEIAHSKQKDYRGFFRGDHYFSRIRSVERKSRFNGGQVYNLEVEVDNSYIVSSVSVHNCVGQRGTRVMTVMNELDGEKIDIIEYSENPTVFIAKALSPAKIADVEVDAARMRADVAVPEDQVSLAIGRRGQNVRLAAKLTGWRIDIRGAAGEVMGTSDQEAKEAETSAEAETPVEAPEEKGGEIGVVTEGVESGQGVKS